MSIDLLRPVTVNALDRDGYVTAMAREQTEAAGALAGPWGVPATLVEKVDPSGKLRPFFGDSVVLPVADADQAALEALRAELCTGLEWIFAAPLPATTFHVTVHDLAHGADAAGLEAALRQNRRRCRSIFGEVGAQLAANPELAPLHLRPTAAFDCLNISVILGLAPATEADFRKLVNLHAAFDGVVTAATWLRPHVTLAYFRPVVPPTEGLGRLAARLGAPRHLPEQLTFDLASMAYVEFASMADYHTVLTVAGVAPSAGVNPGG